MHLHNKIKLTILPLGALAYFTLYAVPLPPVGVSHATGYPYSNSAALDFSAINPQQNEKIAINCDYTITESSGKPSPSPTQPFIMEFNYSDPYTLYTGLKLTVNNVTYKDGFMGNAFNITQPEGHILLNIGIYDAKNLAYNKWAINVINYDSSGNIALTNCNAAT